MTLTVFLASLTAVAFAAMLILALTSGRGNHRHASRPVRTHRDERSERRPYR